MKIEGPNKTAGAKGASKAGAKKGTGDSGFDALVGDTEEAEASAPVSRAPSVGALDALLALQGLDNDADGGGSKRARKRAADLLDHLDRVRLGLLNGSIPKTTLEQLAQSISAHREKVMDPKLAEILDEIDLRAQVELAKLGQ